MDMIVAPIVGVLSFGVGAILTRNHFTSLYIKKRKLNLVKQYSTDEVPVVPYSNPYNFDCPRCDREWEKVENCAYHACSCEDYPFVHFHMICCGNDDPEKRTPKVDGCRTRFIMIAKGVE